MWFGQSLFGVLGWTTRRRKEYCTHSSCPVYLWESIFVSRPFVVRLFALLSRDRLLVGQSIAAAAAVLETYPRIDTSCVECVDRELASTSSAVDRSIASRANLLILVLSISVHIYTSWNPRETAVNSRSCRAACCCLCHHATTNARDAAVSRFFFVV